MHVFDFKPKASTVFRVCKGSEVGSRNILKFIL